MIRNILIVTVASFFLSVVCLSVAVSIAGPEIISQGAWGWGDGGWTWGWKGIHGHHNYGWSHRYPDDRADSDQSSASRELAWSGEELQVQVPASVTFTQAPGPAKLVIRGPKDTLDHLHVADGVIGVDAGPYDGESLTIELTAPKVTRFAMNGSGHLNIAGFKQDSLDLRVSGNADIAAQGAARSVKLVISGSGSADLGSLAMDTAEVNISGSGSTKLGPKASAKLDISGSGEVTLTSHPKHLESHVSGSGTIDQDEAATPDEPAPPEKPAKPAKSGKSV